MKTYDIYFNNETDSNNKGFKSSFDVCMNYIQLHNGSDHGFFFDYKGGTVAIICNETFDNVYETAVI